MRISDWSSDVCSSDLIGRQVTPACIDTDPVNQTFAGYKAFTAKRLELMRDGNIDPRAFDQLIEGIMTAPEDAVFIVDNGAATFVPLSAYMFENDVAAFLQDRKSTRLNSSN